MNYLDTSMNIYVADFERNPELYDESVDINNIQNVSKEAGKITRITQTKDGKTTTFGYVISRFDHISGLNHTEIPSWNSSTTDAEKNAFYAEAISILIAHYQYSRENNIVDSPTYNGIALNYMFGPLEENYPWGDFNRNPILYHYPKRTDNLIHGGRVFPGAGNGCGIRFGLQKENPRYASEPKLDNMSVTDAGALYEDCTYDETRVPQWTYIQIGSDTYSQSTPSNVISNFIALNIINPYVVDLAVQKMAAQEPDFDKWDMFKRWMSYTNVPYPLYSWSANGEKFLACEIFEKYIQIAPSGEKDRFFPYISCIPHGTGSEEPYTFITRGVITDYIFCQWIDAYNEAGQYSLTLPMSQEVSDLLQNGRYLLISDSEKVMVVEKNTFNANLKSDGYIFQSYGRSLESVLDRRVAFPGMAFNTNVYKGNDGLRAALYDMFEAFFIHPEINAKEDSSGEMFFYYPERRVEFFDDTFDKDSFIKRAFRASVNKVITKDHLLKVFTEECQAQNLGFKIVPVNRYGSKAIVWQMILYTGEDKSYFRQDKTKPLMIFSPTLRNVNAVSTTRDSTSEKTIVFCGLEKDSETYIDMTKVQSGTSVDETTGIELIDVISANKQKLITNIKDKITTFLDTTPIAFTGILYMALAAARKDKDYSVSVESIKTVNGGDTKYFNNSTGEVNYPTSLIQKEEASDIVITFIMTYGMDDMSGAYGTGKGKFKLSDVLSSSTQDPAENFRDSTIHGWLTTPVLKEATRGLNQTTFKSVLGIVSKSSVQAWFITLDRYTSSYGSTKWLCQQYNRDSYASGIERKEAFVEDEGKEDEDWDASAINRWRTSTPTISVDNLDDDEETDEEILERLYDNARKKSSEYMERKEIDADCEMYEYEYRGSGRHSYDLGDIIQIDDGYGNVEQEIISSVTITNDTSSGKRIIPSFSHYNRLPTAYTRLDWLQVANMMLPVKFNRLLTNSPSNASGLNMIPNTYFIREVDIPEIQNKYSNIASVVAEMNSKITEIEFVGRYTIDESPGSTPTPLKDDFAMISAVGREEKGVTFYKSSAYCGITDITHVIPFMVLNTNLLWPNDAFELDGHRDNGQGGKSGPPRDKDEDEETDNRRYIDFHINDAIISINGAGKDYNLQSVYYYGGNYNGVLDTGGHYTDNGRHGLLPDGNYYSGMSNDTSVDDSSDYKLSINKIVIDGVSTFNNAGRFIKMDSDFIKMYYSLSSINDSDAENGDGWTRRPMTDVYFDGNKFINEGYNISKQGLCITGQNTLSTNNNFKAWYDSSADYRYVLDTNTYGQVNSDYLWLKQGDSSIDFSTEAPYAFTRDYPYYKNIVLGGYLFYDIHGGLSNLDNDVSQYIDSNNKPTNDNTREGASYYRAYASVGDSKNGVRIKSLNIYEYDSSLRQIAFDKNDVLLEERDIFSKKTFNPLGRKIVPTLGKLGDNGYEIDVTGCYCINKKVAIGNERVICYLYIKVPVDKIVGEDIDKKTILNKGSHIAISKIKGQIYAFTRVSYESSEYYPNGRDRIDLVYLKQSQSYPPIIYNPYVDCIYAHGLDDFRERDKYRAYYKSGASKYLEEFEYIWLILRYTPTTGYTPTNPDDFAICAFPYVDPKYQCLITGIATDGTDLNEVSISYDAENNLSPVINNFETITDYETQQFMLDSGKINKVYSWFGGGSDQPVLYEFVDQTFKLTNSLIAEYPSIASRKFVHEYIPVMYNNYEKKKSGEIDNREKYGLYDLIDQEFVPINYGDNDVSTFIAAGGEVRRE